MADDIATSDSLGLADGQAAAGPAPADAAELLARSPLFEALPKTALAQIAERLTRHAIGTGGEILRRGEEVPGLFLIESGRLAAIVRNPRAGTTQVVATLGAPQAIAASRLVSGGAVHDVEYIALRPTVVQLLPREVFDAVLRQAPAFAAAVVRAVAAEAALITRYGAIPWADLSSLAFDERLWACLPTSLAGQVRICPLDFNGDTMTVAMADPREVSALDELSAAVPGVRFRVVATSAEDLRRFVGMRGASRREGAPSTAPPPSANEIRASFRFLTEEMSTRDARGRAPSTPPPAVGAIEEIVGVGLGAGASDIHIEPERQGVSIRYRVDGQLRRRREAFSSELARPIVIRLKTLARLDITETRRPQDGRISVELSSGRLVDLRISTVPAKFGEKVALRVLDAGEAIADLKTLFVVDQVRTLVARLLSRRTGFLLVTGPTGAGKSTTLYSALNACRGQHLNIMTVEDPIEYHLDGVTQVEVHPEAGTTFAAVLRALLRQDPNIILVGEMRDAETARIAVEASLTGHLVMSSLHTNGTLEAVARLRDMGIEPYALANGLLAVLHQRLLQRVCPHCAAPFEYPAFLVDTLVRHGVFGTGPVPPLVRGAGCARCQNTGLLGRVMACGLLVVNDELRDAIGRRADLGELRAVAARGAHIELHRYAGALLRMGVTVPGEVIPLLEPSDDRDG
jgi:type IV pilus assembly protein PilB